MSDDEPDVLLLLRNMAQSRRRLALAMLDGYAADAFEKPGSPEDIAEWTEELADAEREIARLSN